MRKIYLIDSPGVVMGNYGETDEEKVLKGNYGFLLLIWDYSLILSPVLYTVGP